MRMAKSKDINGVHKVGSKTHSDTAINGIALDVKANGHSGANAHSHNGINGNGAPALGPVSGNGELAEKIKELVRLAQEQGYLTYHDINEALPHGVTSPEEIEE